MFYGKVFKALNKAKVKYVVAGGVAVVLHGYNRFTQDLDLIVELTEDNLDKLYDALKAIGYVPKVPVNKQQLKDEKLRAKWKKEKGMIVFSFVKKDPPFYLIDIFINDKLLFGKVRKEREVIKIKNIEIPLISIDDLIGLKKKAGRGKDIDDITQLREIKKINNHEKK